MLCNTFCLVAMATTLAGEARAAWAASIEATHTSEANGCPSAQQLATAVNRGLGRSELSPRTGSEAESKVRFTVEFKKEHELYTATLRSLGARPGERTISDQGADCSALGDAVIVLLVVLLDSGDSSPPWRPNRLARTGSGWRAEQVFQEGWWAIGRPPCR